MAEYRSLTLRGAMSGALRTAMFREREHIVIPVVALVEGVVHPVNSEHKEYVPATELARTPDAWNGEPVMFNHPDAGGQKISANSPEVLEAAQLGQVFHTRMDKTRLLMEAYIDPARVDKVGEQAQRLLDTLTAGGVVEVSVGAFVTTEKTKGTFNGRAYDAIWRDIVPDHLALLPEGTVGACSVQDGCGAGAPRAAAVHLITAEGYSFEEDTPPMPNTPVAEGRTLRERLRDMIKSTFVPRVTAAAVAEGATDTELRRALWNALRSKEPAFVDVIDNFVDDNVVVYAVNPDDVWTLYSRPYTFENGEVTLGADRTEVEPITKYESVTAAAASAAAAPPAPAPCGCQKPSTSALSAQKETFMVPHKNAERITALIANPKTPWTEFDRAHLEAQDDSRLASLEAQANPAPEPPPAKSELKLEDLPQAWRQAIEAQAAQEAAARTETVNALAAAQTVFSKAELEAMPLEQLTKIATLAKAPVSAPAQRAPQAQRTLAAGEEGVPPPPSYNDRIKAAAAKH